MSSHSGMEKLPDYGHDICAEKGKAILGRAEAKRVAKRQSKRSGDNVTAFKCPSCEGYHVGRPRPHFRSGRIMRDRKGRAA